MKLGLEKIRQRKQELLDGVKGKIDKVKDARQKEKNDKERVKAIREEERRIAKAIRKERRRLAVKKFLSKLYKLAFLGAVFVVLMIFIRVNDDSQPSSVYKGSEANKQSDRTSQKYGVCVDKGIEYYKAIGSYPYLSTGEDAHNKVLNMCSNSSMAF